MRRSILVILLLMLGLASCGGAPTSDPQPAPSPTDLPQPPTGVPPTDSPVEEEMIEEEPAMPFELTSPAFMHEADIPVKFSCDGDDISPPLAWSEPPVGTESLALIMDDPDAPVGTWDHWILFNIPADKGELEENLPVTGKNQDPGSIFVGNNSWNRSDYGGPCPPGGTHRYFFKLYALDTTLSFLPGVKKDDLLNAMEGHILAETHLMGTFTR